MTQEKADWRILQEEQKKIVQKVRSRDEQYSERRNHLNLLKQMVLNHEDKWLEALRKDLGKSVIESYTSEISLVLNEIDYALKHLKKWMSPEKSNRLVIGGIEKTQVYRYPYGSVLIISPWNYPLQLSLVPLVGALASGNSCFIKPSEYSKATSRLLKELAEETFDSKVLTVIEGDANTSQALLDLTWDFIFFTGSEKVGRSVHQQAAQNLTPVVLELGGKNPCIVEESGLSQETIRQIVWGKLLNSGQSCIAPDTVYVHESVYLDFLKMAKETIQSFYGENPQNSSDYGRVISPRHHKRITGYLEEGRLFVGGSYSLEDLYIEPTILTDIKPESKILSEEIFGPVLPVIPYADLGILYDTLSETPSPLVSYLFTKSEESIRLLEHKVTSGAVSVNQVIKHAASSRIPFGGVGESGFGRYHGENSYETFTYQKVSYTHKNLFNFSLQYPPYQKKQLKWLKRFRKWLF